MKRLFHKHETMICILLIIFYIVINSYCMQNFGIADYRTTIINTFLSLILIFLMINIKRVDFYGLKKVSDPKKYLYFIPLLFIVSVNLWNGVNISHSNSEILFHILTMINIGFIEEVIFRGFLFKMMEKDNTKIAILVSSVTFGIGHIVNLLNGADLIPTLFQVCYAISIGYLFVIIYYRSQSIVPCIIAHSLNNSLSIFNIDNNVSLYIAPVFLIIFPLIYATYINKMFRSKDLQPPS